MRFNGHIAFRAGIVDPIQFAIKHLIEGDRIIVAVMSFRLRRSTTNHSGRRHVTSRRGEAYLAGHTLAESRLLSTAGKA